VTALAELTRWASALTFDDIPERVVELAKTQILSQLAAIRAGRSHPQGRALERTFGPALQASPKCTAVILAGLGSWLHFDDTAYAGHLSNSTVTVPLAYARSERRSGRDLIAAVVAANECAARVTAAATLGPFRGQMAAHTSTVGAVCGRMHCQGAPASAWLDAASLALAAPTWSLRHGFMGSDARLLGAALPVRSALDACDATAAGLRGAPDILEHPDGFLAAFATVPLPGAVTAGLGRLWHTETLSFKVHPSGPGTDAAVDCAIALHPQLAQSCADDGEPLAFRIARVTVEVSLYTLLLDKLVSRYLDGPSTALSALASSTPYAVATALLTGSVGVRDFAAPAVEAPERWRVAALTELAHDPRMTASLLAADAPFGEALRAAGPRAAGWLREFGGAAADRLGPTGAGRARPRESYQDSVKATPARVKVLMIDGQTFEHERNVPVGAVGSGTRAEHRELVRAKFRATGGRECDADAVAGLEGLDPARVARLIATALSAGPPGSAS
jgi:2-methylcitrate dehydratase PrpD